jgi:hypothetical protein
MLHVVFSSKSSQGILNRECPTHFYYDLKDMLLLCSIESFSPYSRHRRQRRTPGYLIEQHRQLNQMHVVVHC